MSSQSMYQRLFVIFASPASHYFRTFIGVLISPLLLVILVGGELFTLGPPGLFWGGYTASLLLLAAMGFGSQMYSRNAYQGKGLSISPTYKSQGWA